MFAKRHLWMFGFVLLGILACAPVLSAADDSEMLNDAGARLSFVLPAPVLNRVTPKPFTRLAPAAPQADSRRAYDFAHGPSLPRPLQQLLCTFLI